MISLHSSSDKVAASVLAVSHGHKTLRSTKGANVHSELALTAQHSIMRQACSVNTFYWPLAEPPAASACTCVGCVAHAASVPAAPCCI